MPIKVGTTKPNGQAMLALRQRSGEDAFAGAEGGEVGGFGMVHDDRDRGLFGHQLARLGDGQADLLARHEAEEYSMILDIWTRGVTPRIALALPAGQS